MRAWSCQCRRGGIDDPKTLWDLHVNVTRACVASYTDSIYICAFPGFTIISYVDQMESTSGDGADGAPCFRMASYLWVFGISKFTNQRQHGVVLLVDQLNCLRADLQRQIEKSSLEVEDNRKMVCKLLQRGTGRRDAVVVRLLKKSMALKKVRDGFVGRVSTVELQIEALENSDFNRNMLNTMQNTADTMRKMGLDKGLSQADSVISELEENMQLAGDMTQSLSSPIVTDCYMNDDEMDAELDEIMGVSVQDRPTTPLIAVPSTTTPLIAVPSTTATMESPRNVSESMSKVGVPDSQSLLVFPIHAAAPSVQPNFATDTTPESDSSVRGQPTAAFV
jgi:hypothetical protein